MTAAARGSGLLPRAGTTRTGAPEHVPLIDLQAQYATIRDELLEAVHRVLASQHFILGPEVEALEDELSVYCESGHSVGVSSGTDALLAALMALGIEAGDEVITTPLTWVSTAEVIARVGAKPVFVDVDPATYTIDPSRVEAAITSRTRAIIPVHFYGQMADMDPILDLASQRQLAVIEDCAQAIGAEYDGHRAGSMGDVGCFSFFPAKVLGGPGDGGLVTTNDDRLARTLRLLRSHGADPGGRDASLIGGNFRLDALAAAYLRAKLPHLEAWIGRRRGIALRYQTLFREADLADSERNISLPTEGARRRHVYYQFIIRCRRRDELLVHLARCGIGSKVYYPVPLHLQTVFQYLGHRPGTFPESERAALETLAIPMFPELTEGQSERVVAAIADFYAAA